MVSIKVDEAALRDMRPELDTTAAIRLWAQQQIDLRIQQMRAERGQKASQNNLWLAIEQDPKLTLKPSFIEADGGDAIDLEAFRADLHKMVEEIYAKA